MWSLGSILSTPAHRTDHHHHGRDKPAGHRPPAASRPRNVVPKLPRAATPAGTAPEIPATPILLSSRRNLFYLARRHQQSRRTSSPPPRRNACCHKLGLCRRHAARQPAPARTAPAWAPVLGRCPSPHPCACGAIPLLHIPAAISADFRLIVDTGSPKNIYNNAADLFPL